MIQVQASPQKKVPSFRDRRIVWALATHYAEGQAMITTAVIVSKKYGKAVEGLLKRWELYATDDASHRLDLHALSTQEPLTVESSADAMTTMGFELPTSDVDENPFEIFKKCYRIYPYLSRVEV